MGFFHVVHFDGTEEVEIIPDSWLIDGNKCLWPNRKNVPQSWVKNSASPTPSWVTYACKIMRTFDSFKTATKGRKLAEDTSDLASEVDLGKGRRRKKRVLSPSISSEACSDGSADDLNYPQLFVSTPKKALSSAEPPGNPQSIQKQNPRPALKPKPSDASPHHVTHLSQTVISSQTASEALRRSPRIKVSQPRPQQIKKTLFPNTHLPSSRPTSLYSSVASTSSSPSPHNDIRMTPVVNESIKTSSRLHKKRSIEDLYEKQCSSKRTLKTIKTDLEWIKIEIKKLVSRPSTVVSNTSVENLLFDGTVQLPIMPLPDVNSLNAFEQDLVDDKVFKKLVYDFKILGGRTAAEATRKMLKFIFSDLLSAEFTWFGTTNKKKLCSLKVVSALQNAVRLIIPAATNTDIEKAAKEWLRHSQQRLKNCKGREHQEDDI